MYVKRYVPVILMLVLAVCFSPLRFFAQAAGQTVTITGDIEEEEEDESGNIIKVRISYLNDKYQIEGISIANLGKGKDLLKAVGRSAKVTGTKVNAESGNPVLQIATYEYLPEPAPEPEADVGTESAPLDSQGNTGPVQ